MFDSPLLTFSSQTPDSGSGIHTIKVLSIDADSSDMGWVKLLLSVIQTTDTGTQCT